MKIEAEIVGAQSGIDFSTMEQSHVVVLRVFGQDLAVPVSEEVFDHIVVSAAKVRGVGVDFESTRSELTPEQRTAAASNAVTPPSQEQDFSIGSLHEAPPAYEDEVEEEPPSDSELGGLFEEAPREQSDPEMLAKLRGRAAAQIAQSRPAPLPPAHAPMPKLAGFGGSADDAGIEQG